MQLDTSFWKKALRDPRRWVADASVRLAALLLCTITFSVFAQGLLDDLAAAATNDRADDVRRLLARGMDPNSVDSGGDTMLCIAARNGSSAALAVLLAAKANPNQPNRFGDTPLLLASLKGDLDSVRALVAAGAHLNPRGWTPLMYAATGGHDEVATFLLQRGADINASSPNGTSALMMAIREHHVGTARLLIGRGADVNHRNQDGATPIEWATRGEETDLVKELRRAGARD